MRLSALGDVSHVVPILRNIQANHPESAITWIVGKLEYQLVKNIPGVEFVVVDKSGGWAALRETWRQLRGSRFDVLLHMQVSLRACILSLGIKAHTRIGFDRARARQWQWLVSNRKISARKNQHVLDGFLGFVEALGLPADTPCWDIPIAAEDREFATTQLGDTPTMIINPCSSSRLRNFRNWRAERYAAVADYAHKSYGLNIALTGGPDSIEREMGEEISAKTSAPINNLIGMTSIPQLFALLDRARVVIAPDTGPAHLANAAGTPVIGLYASSNPQRTGPYNALHWVVDQYPEALQKFNGKRIDRVRWGTRVRDPGALDLIGFDQVIAMLDRVMRETSGPQ